MGGCTSLHGVSNHQTAGFPNIRSHTVFPHVQYGWVYRVAWREQPAGFPNVRFHKGFSHVQYGWVYRVAWREQPAGFPNVRFHKGFSHVQYGWVYRVAWREQSPNCCRFPTRQVHVVSFARSGVVVVLPVGDNTTRFASQQHSTPLCSPLIITTY